MEVDCIHKSFFIAESMCTDFDGFDPTIDAFSRAITDINNNGIDDSPEMLSNHSGDIFDWLKPTAQLNVLFQVPSCAFIVPHVSERLAQALEGTGADGMEGPLLR